MPPRPGSRRREIGPRLERGYLTATAEGAQSPVAVGDFERCLQLAGTDLRDYELFATLSLSVLITSGARTCTELVSCWRSSRLPPSRARRLTARRASWRGCAANSTPPEYISTEPPAV
jgi:hypothetical protein